MKVIKVCISLSFRKPPKGIKNLQWKRLKEVHLFRTFIIQYHLYIFIGKAGQGRARQNGRVFRTFPNLKSQMDKSWGNKLLNAWVAPGKYYYKNTRLSMISFAWELRSRKLFEYVLSNKDENRSIEKYMYSFTTIFLSSI